MNARLSVVAALATAIFAGGCATSPYEPMTFEEAAYDTVFLGPNGQIIADPRAKKLKKTKTRKEKPLSATQAAQPRVPQGYWEGDGVSGSPSITISLSEQKAFFYKGGKLVGMSPVSTGREGYNTPSGRFRVSQRNADHVSNLYGNYVDENGNVVVSNVGVHRDPKPAGTRFQGAPMPYFLRINGAVGLHGGYLPGYPASHGCIRLPMDMAEVFFANAPTGTPVSVTR